MAVTLDLQPKPQWETIEAGGRSLQLLVRKASRLVRLHVAATAEKDFGGAVQMLVDESVLDWREVNDADNKPIPFSRAGLDVLMNTDDELGLMIQGKLIELNAFGKNASDPTSMPQPTPTD